MDNWPIIAGLVFSISIVLLVYISAKSVRKVCSLISKKQLEQKDIKCGILTISVLLLALFIFQVFFRYKEAQIGMFELRYDRLISKIYFRHIAEEKWKEFDRWGNVKIKNFKTAKAILYAAQSRGVPYVDEE